MQSDEIRKKFLMFFEERGHVALPSASLVPEGDVTTLFTGSGMQPLLPYLLGKPHPDGRRIVDIQKCFRSEDIDEVGDNRHTTFFEMLGNWSLGDYFKEEQLSWFFEFLTEEVGLQAERLYVTVFAGDADAGIPRDEESARMWQQLFQEQGIDAKAVELVSVEQGGDRGMQGGRIFFYKDKNWWSRAGIPSKMPAGEPGGPDSEVFYEFTQVPHDATFGNECHPNCDCGRFVELGNSVFMEYRKTASGAFEKLTQRNVDFGGGLERISAASNDNPDVFAIDGIAPLMAAIRSGAGKANVRSERIIADHLRASVFLLADGVRPSNKEAGYVLRRLIRRTLVHMKQIGAPSDAILAYAENIIRTHGAAYIDLAIAKMPILDELRREMDKFAATLEKGMKEFSKRYPDAANRVEEPHMIGKEAFDLYQTYGFPVDVIRELLKERGYGFDEAAFQARIDEEFRRHQEISRAGQEKKFGGHGLLLDTGELRAANEEELKKVTRLHTATHMLQQALREVLGNEVKQAGSDITVDRTRFDFTFPRKLTPEELRRVEIIINQKIKEDLPMQKVVLPKTEAEKTGALFFFKEKYPDPVNVYFIGMTLEDAWSKEFCGGPHVSRTGEIGEFRIAKEEAVGAGTRRIRGTVFP